MDTYRVVTVSVKEQLEDGDGRREGEGEIDVGVVLRTASFSLEAVL
jgi:hypothetical protein